MNHPKPDPSGEQRRQFRNVDPPLGVAWGQALSSIRIRFKRHAVTVVGIALGIAFFSSVMVVRSAAISAVEDPQARVRLQWLVLTSLVMCLVGVTNSMLMSVTERYREIGTIKCLGASDGFIVKVFFLEALILGAIGSFGGSLLGALAMMTAEQGSGLSLARLASIVLLGAGLGLAMTIVASIAPAYQAARMPAAAALRVEI